MQDAFKSPHCWVQMKRDGHTEWRQGEHVEYVSLKWKEITGLTSFLSCPGRWGEPPQSCCYSNRRCCRSCRTPRPAVRQLPWLSGSHIYKAADDKDKAVFVSKWNHLKPKMTTDILERNQCTDQHVRFHSSRSKKVQHKHIYHVLHGHSDVAILATQ